MTGCVYARNLVSEDTPRRSIHGQGDGQWLAFIVLEGDEIVELDVTRFGKRSEECDLPFASQLGQELQLAGYRDAVDVEENGDASHRDTGAEQFEYMRIDAPLMLAVGAVKGG